MSDDTTSKFGDLVADPPPPKKRRGRQPGSKNKVKNDAPEKPKKVKRKYKKRRAKASPPPEREYSCFLDEDNGVQLCRADGDGDPIQLTAADALAIAAFVERHRTVLEA